eukprot:8130445-Pyramimonas_sp.AAC.1
MWCDASDVSVRCGVLTVTRVVCCAVASDVTRGCSRVTCESERCTTCESEGGVYPALGDQSQGTREHIPGIGTNHRGVESIF